jgi:hypothetical protein
MAAKPLRGTCRGASAGQAPRLVGFGRLDRHQAGGGDPASDSKRIIARSARSRRERRGSGPAHLSHISGRTHVAGRAKNQNTQPRAAGDCKMTQEPLPVRREGGGVTHGRTSSGSRASTPHPPCGPLSAPPLPPPAMTPPARQDSGIPTQTGSAPRPAPPLTAETGPAPPGPAAASCHATASAAARRTRSRRSRSGCSAASCRSSSIAAWPVRRPEATPPRCAAREVSPPACFWSTFGLLAHHRRIEAVLAQEPRERPAPFRRKRLAAGVVRGSGPGPAQGDDVRDGSCP